MDLHKSRLPLVFTKDPCVGLGTHPLALSFCINFDYDPLNSLMLDSISHQRVFMGKRGLKLLKEKLSREQKVETLYASPRSKEA